MSTPVKVLYGNSLILPNNDMLFQMAVMRHFVNKGRLFSTMH